MKDAFDLTTAENTSQRSARGSVDEIKIPLDVSRISLWGSHQKQVMGPTMQLTMGQQEMIFFCDYSFAF